MPFQSEKQRRYMHANLPEIANRWEKKYGLGGIAELNAELNSLPEYYLPKNQGGRIGYDKGLKVLPKIDITQSGSTPAEGIDVDVIDRTYGLSGSYQGDNWYAGGEFQTGNVNVKVQEEGNTVFHDTMSKDDLKKLYVGLGQKEGDRVEVGTDRKGNYTLNIVKSFNQGGFVPAHEAGIYGLAEGGTIAGGHQIGTRIGNRTGFGNPFGYSDSPGTGSSTSSTSGGGGGDAGHLTHNVPVSLGGTKPDPVTRDTSSQDKPFNIHRDTGLEEQAYVMVGGKKVHQPKWGTKDDPREQIQLKGDEDYETIVEINKENALRKFKYDDTLTKNERENLGVNLGLIAPKQKMPLWKKVLVGAAVVSGVGPILGVKVPSIINTGAQINTFHNQLQTGLDRYNKFTGSNFTLEGLTKKVTDTKKFRTEEKLRAETKKLQEALPPGHPERIALEAQKKTRTTDTVERDGKDVNIKYTSEEITDTNDAKADIAQLEQKYLEMDEASEAALLRQREMEAKKQAWLRQLRQTYMSAQGGRVQAGYNTGGLSNLFRLKNV